MIALNAQRVRFAADASQPFKAVTDAITGAAISLPSGSALQIECLFYFQNQVDGSLLDLTAYSQIVVQLQAKSDPHNGTVYYSGSVAAANFNNAATVETWAAGAAASAHIALFIPSALNVVPPGNTNYWLCVYGVSTDAAADPVLLCACNLSGKDSGIPTNAAAMALLLKMGAKIPFTCLDGQTRDLTIAAGPGGIWVTAINQAGYNGAGQAAYSVLCADALYRDLTLQLQDGSYTLAINQNGHS